MTVEEFWDNFISANLEISSDTPYQTWCFGNKSAMAAELADLVITGRKRATASLQDINLLKPEQAPIDNGYSVVTNFEGQPLCVIQTTEIRLIPFNEVDAEFAFDEGEGDQSLDYWRGVHWDYFTAEAVAHGVGFDEHSVICCERFRLLFPLPEHR